MSEMQEKLGRDEVVMRAVITVFVLFGVLISLVSQFTSMISSSFLYLIGACSLGLICTDYALTLNAGLARLKRFVIRRSPLLLVPVAICSELLLRQSIVYQSIVYQSSALSDNTLLFSESRIKVSFIYFAVFNVLSGLILGVALRKVIMFRRNHEALMCHFWRDKKNDTHSKNTTASVSNKCFIWLFGQVNSSQRLQLSIVAGVVMMLILWLAAIMMFYLISTRNSLNREVVYTLVLAISSFIMFYKNKV